MHRQDPAELPKRFRPTGPCVRALHHSDGLAAVYLRAEVFNELKAKAERRHDTTTLQVLLGSRNPAKCIRNSRWQCLCGGCTPPFREEHGTARWNSLPRS